MEIFVNEIKKINPFPFWEMLKVDPENEERVKSVGRPETTVAVTADGPHKPHYGTGFTGPHGVWCGTL